MSSQNNINISNLICTTETDRQQNIRLNNLEKNYYDIYNINITQNNQITTINTKYNDLSNNIVTKKLLVNREIVENLDIIPSRFLDYPSLSEYNLNAVNKVIGLTSKLYFELGMPLISATNNPAETGEFDLSNYDKIRSAAQNIVEISKTVDLTYIKDANLIVEYDLALGVAKASILWEMLLVTLNLIFLYIYIIKQFFLLYKFT